MFNIKQASSVLIPMIVVVAVSAYGQNMTGPSLTVQQIETPARPGSGQPNLYASADGRIYLSWIEPIDEKRRAVRFAVRKDGQWSEARTIVEAEDLLVNWADFPSLVALRGEALIAHWLVRGEPGTHAYTIRTAVSSNSGKTWSNPAIPHTDKSESEHGFISMVPLPDGRVATLWLDGRNMKEGTHGTKEDLGDMSLRYTVIGADGRASQDIVVDPRVCECCQTSAALTSEGPIAVYRDRSEKEVRDITIARYIKGRWSEPRNLSADGWEIHGCPVNGPSVAADGRRVAVAWFTAAKETPRVKVIFSNDAGATFGQPIQVDEGAPIGRVDLLILPDGSALVSWLERTANGGAIKARRIKSDGSRGQPLTIAESNVSRAAGFPQMARVANEVYFAWTQPGSSSKVQMAIGKITRHD